MSVRPSVCHSYISIIALGIFLILHAKIENNIVRKLTKPDLKLKLLVSRKVGIIPISACFSRVFQYFSKMAIRLYPITFLFKVIQVLLITF